MRALLLFLLSLLATTSLSANVEALSYDYRGTLNTLSDHETMEKIAEDTDLAVRGMIRLAVWQLRKSGHNSVADEIEADGLKWQGYLQRKVASGESLKDIGDHDPYSVWLSVVYEVLRYYLGDEMMEFLHLDDIKIINFGIVVVFNPDIAFDQKDYLQHWTPFWGVVSYWTIWIGCEVGTYGTGWFLICTPAGMAGEYVTVKWIAPPLGKRVYTRWQENQK